MGISPVSRQILDPTIAFFPEYSFVSVAFGIYIPKRLQNELADYPEDHPVETENFDVLISYNFDPMPVTVVSYKTTSLSPSPSTAVMVSKEIYGARI
jgi:hypothetical protein